MDKTLSEKDRLRLMWEFYKDLVKDGKSDVEIEKEFFSYMTALAGYNKLPQVVSDKDFAGLDAETYYRGVPSVDYHANTLCDYDYYHGGGIDGNGFYASTDKAVAEGYTYNTKGDILTFKFKGSTFSTKDADEYRFYATATSKIFKKKSSIKTEDKQKLDIINDYYNKTLTQDSERLQFRSMLTLDNSFIPIFLGYDAIQYDFQDKDGHNIVILNRNSMQVSESEFNRITSLSKNYQGGVIDFEKKTEDEFLME